MGDAVGVMTERLLVDAGVGPGMRVLDAGCGRGDIAILLGKMVGIRGRVVGVDRDAGPLDKARIRAEELLMPHVSFLEGDLNEVEVESGSFDAVFGRRVLLYQPDPEATVRHLARALRPGGLMIFQEHDATMVPGRRVPLPLYEQAQGWVWETVRREGANLHMGFDLPGVLRGAGLVVEHVRAEGLVQTPEIHYGFGSIVRFMLPRIERQGVATAAEIDVETLDRRLIAERQAANATFISDMIFGAWARQPGGSAGPASL